ncbi:MAG: thioredoxin family protein [Thermomicrobiales bacterium]|nr:thioredoxin family protein [Thermomicrobiales bacterium]
MASETIQWLSDWQEALSQSRALKRPVLIDVWQDNCSGCERLANETFTDPEVVTAVNSRFIPVSLHMFRDRAVVRDWGLFWTPTVLFADRTGRIRYESVNYVPADTMLDVLDIGEARVAMRWKEMDTAIARLRDVEIRHPEGPLTAEAIYWRGMAEYFRGGNTPALAKAVWAEITERFPDSIWARRQP